MTSSPSRRALRALAGACLIGAVPLACNTKSVSRIDPASVTDLSGRWNDVDSRLVADTLIRQSLSGRWVQDYAASHGGRPPTVIVGAFRNRSMEHIPVGTFVNDLERAFVNSNEVRVVASAQEREEVRAERTDQQENAAADTRARLAREQGANYMLQGEVQSIEDSEKGEKIVFYQVDATLIDLESNAKVWIGQHKIKKYIERKRIGF